MEWKGNHYYYADDASKWVVAVAKAKKLGGQLVCIETKEEADFIFKTFAGKETAWTGGTNQTGKKIWINKKPIDMKIADYHNWDSGTNTRLSIRLWSAYYGSLEDNGPHAMYNYIVEWD